MKVKCKENVQDKNTNEWYVKDKEYDLPKERAEEVVKAYNGRYFEYIEEVTEEVVQAVATAIVEEAEEKNKTIEKVVNEIVEEKPKRTRKSTKK